MLKIKKNPNWTEQQHIDFSEKVKLNQNYCPCMLLKNASTKCMCKEFREMDTVGECHCGRYIKYLDEDNIMETNLEEKISYNRYGDFDFATIAKNAISEYYKSKVSNQVELDMKDIYIVWFCKTLQNWKALLSTSIPDTRYFEFTWNGDKQEGYLDCYVKENNKLIK